jgi:ABC-type transport system involved in multi-copper enzyme maturation permease subunit
VNVHPSLLRLTGVELRKMVDTRAGRWFLGVIALISVAVVVLDVIFGGQAERRLAPYFVDAAGIAGFLLPVLGILAVTGEWSQRTALTTFALVPKRSRVATAKLLSSVAIGVLAVAVCLAAAALANVATLVFTDGDGSFRVAGSALGTTLLYMTISVVGGVAFGMLLLNSPLAIVLYFFLPLLWATLGATIKNLQNAAEWLDITTTTVPLGANEMTGGAWARLAVSVGVWVVLPLVLGWLRLLRKEVS